LPSLAEIELLQSQVEFSDDIKGKKIAVFDLDETLVHCDTKDYTKSEVLLSVNLPNGEVAKIGVNIRPHVYECLREVKKNYVIVAYTASHQIYADTILNYIDPLNTFFSYRLYRNNCLKVKVDDESIYVKDLRIFKGISLLDIIIIDNSVLSFSFQLDNGIPILPFYDNKDDNELQVLTNYLNHLSKIPDIRMENKKFMKLDSLIVKKNKEEQSKKDESIRLKLFVEETNFFNDAENITKTPPKRINNSYLSDYTSSLMSESGSMMSVISEKSSDISSKKHFQECQMSYRTIFQHINCLNN